MKGARIKEQVWSQAYNSIRDRFLLPAWENLKERPIRGWKTSTVLRVAAIQVREQAYEDIAG